VILFMTMALAVAMVACQGAVGKTGEKGPAGPSGEPPEPVNYAPIARATAFEPMMLREDGDAGTRNVAANFVDPDEDTLTFSISSVSATPEDAVTAGLADGILTITPVAAGTADITVTATDGSKSASATLHVTVADAGEPIYIGSLTTAEALLFGDQLVIPGTEIVSSFEGEALSFGAVSSGDPVVQVINAEDNTVTIIALRVVGNATVTITATDEDDETISHSIKISVVESLAPQRSDMMTPDPVNLTAGGDDHVIPDVSMYFTDPAGGDLDYEAKSSKPAVATAVAVGSMVTITPLSASDVPVMVTVTAMNSHEPPATLTISVTVNPAPVAPPAAPTWKKEIPNVTFEHDGAPQTFMLEEYFDNATMYAVDHGDGTVVMAKVNAEQTVLTLTRVGAGSAVVEITPSNRGGNGTTQSINVMVEKAPRGPELKPNMSFMAVKMPMIADTGAATVDADGLAALNAATKRYMLTKYIRDPDGFAADTLTFSVKTEDPTVVAAYATPLSDQEINTTDIANDAVFAARNVVTKATLDKMMVEASDVTIRGRKAGTTMITVTATDVSNESETWKFNVTVVATANNGPSLGTDDNLSTGTAIVFPDTDTDVETNPYGNFVGRDDVRRFKETDTSKKWKLDLATIFNDPDVELNQRTTNDRWRFEAKSTNDDVATVSLEDTRNSEKPDEYNVVVTPVGSGDATIYFVATDSFDESWGGKTGADGMFNAEDPDNVSTFFSVKVNSAPVAQGAQSEPETLKEEGKLKGLTVGVAIDDLRIVDDDPTDAVAVGYFSDKDEDDLRCRFNMRGDSIFGETTTAGVTSINRPSWSATTGDEARQIIDFPVTTKDGTAYLDVWCWDQVGAAGSEVDFEKSPKATLTIHVEFHSSIH
ncbi:MAG: hypothetical protein OXC31_14750, partial [Spirochaetaceae bacterium]|nr:hypothetical protein [Spirochaetaceae bacterium]